MSLDLPHPRTARLPIEVLLSPFASFAKMEAASGILLMASGIAALVLANSSWAESYHTFWNAPVSIGFGRFELTETRLEWVNDGLASPADLSNRDVRNFPATDAHVLCPSL
jgi:NhaA family Na+:H+ antiporter